MPLGHPAGAQVETLKKVDAGHNKHGAGPVKHAAKLENETEVFEHEHVSSELKKQIQSARIAKKLTQAQVRAPPPPFLAARAVFDGVRKSGTN